MIPLRNARRFLFKTGRQPAYAFRVFGKRLKAALGYNFKNGTGVLPEAVTLFLTHRCNLQCQMCGQWGEGGITRKMPPKYVQKELGREKLLSLVDEFAIFKPNITLFGGEPLLHPSCLEIINYIKLKKMHCLMITNGSLLNNFAKELVEADLDELNVSLDGDVSLHDTIRGMTGLFAKITSGLESLNRFKAENNTPRPFINLQCTITRHNYLYLERLTEVARKIKADSLTFHNLIFLTQDLLEKQKSYDTILNCSCRQWEGFVFDAGIDPELLFGKMEEIRSHRYPFAVDFYPNFSFSGLRAYYKNPGNAFREYPDRCLSPWVTAYIFPDGELRPCLNFDFSFGNINQENFLKAWNSAKAVGFRRVLKEKRIFPVCIRCTELYRY